MAGYTVSARYATPDVRGTSASPSGHQSYASFVNVEHGVASSQRRHLVWASPEHAFQVQWRDRMRYSPDAAASIDPSAGELWTGWGAWQGADIDALEVTSGVAEYGGARVLQQPWEFPYDFATYDKVEREVRVRSVNAQSGEVSQWGGAIVEVRYVPRCEVTGAVLEPDGSMTVSVNTNWRRGGHLNLGFRTGTTEQGVEVGEDFSFTVPAACVASSVSGGKVSATASVRRCDLYTNDGAGAASPLAAYYDRSKIAYIVPAGVHSQPSGVPAPQVAIDASGAVSVASTGAAYDKVTAHAEWTDEDGSRWGEDVEMAASGGSWTGSVPFPPLDVEVTVTVACFSGVDWLWSRHAVTVPSEGLVMLDHEGGDHFEMRYDIARSMSRDYARDAVALAGRALPVARLGLPVEGSIDISGRLVNPRTDSFGGAWMAGLAVLDAPHGWLLRCPGGLRRRVIVSGVTLSDETPTLDRFAEVGIRMQEVEG